MFWQYVLPVHLSMQCLWRSEEGTGFAGMGRTMLSHMWLVLRTKLYLLQEQQVLLLWS